MEYRDKLRNRVILPNFYEAVKVRSQELGPQHVILVSCGQFGLDNPVKHWRSFRPQAEIGHVPPYSAQALGRAERQSVVSKKNI